MTDDAPTPTVWSRMLSAGISEDAIRQHHINGTIHLDGAAVTDLDQPAAPPAVIIIRPPSR
ncbi:MAG: hypothetical protein LH603_00805 [Pseudonocardia sp.]|nr:hypothetical protein [Pseudonocardia sp.]